MVTLGGAVRIAAVLALASCAAPPSAPAWVPLWEIADQRAPAWDALTAGMRDANGVMRRRAARTTGALGGAGAIDDAAKPGLVAELARLTKDEQDWVRHEAAFALGQVGGPEAGAALRDRLESGEPGMRYLAAMGLGKNGDVGALDVLARKLGDPEPQVRGAAALAIARLAGDRLRGQPARVDAAKAEELAKALVAALGQENDARTRWRLVYALAHLGVEEAREPLLEVVAQRAETGDARWEKVFAIRGLSALKPLRRTQDALVRVLASPDAAITYEAVAALCSPARQVDAERRASTGPSYDQALEPLLALLEKPPSVHVHGLLARELGRYRDQAVLLGVQAAVAGACRHPNPNVRAAALEGIARLGSSAAEALRDAALDPDFRVRAGAARACAHQGSLNVLVLLATLAGDRDSRVAMAAMQVLAARKAELFALPIAAAALRVRDLAVREEAAPAAKALGRAELLPALIAAWRDSPGLEFAEARKLLVEAAAGVAPQAAELRPFLDEALRDPDVVVRREASKQLRALGADVPAGAVGRAQNLITPALGTDIPFEFLGKRPRVVVTTTKGDFTIALVPELAPLHCWNFVNLCLRGDYDGRIFHRVVPNFVVQGGDPRGDGSGGMAWHGGQLRDEINPLPFDAGVVGMPKTADPDTGGAQIFVTTVPTPHLDGRYTAFGKVVRGMEVVEALEVGDVIVKVRVEG